jgi:hypothetical protein
MTQSLVLEGTLTPDQHWKYTYLPFEVPENIGRIDISYTYDSVIGSDPQLSGGNTVDIGIFDSRGIAPHSSGYRGWTGSARMEFFIALDSATPGYMPGPILPGTWNIILGPYKVAERGCHYRVDITLTETDAPYGEFPPLLRLTNTAGTRVHADGWYKGELHCHSFHSDGDSSPEEIVRLAEANNLDFLALTDHNNLTQRIDLAKINTHLMLIPGYEVTTYYGHWNIWGDKGWIDFRVQSAEDLAAYIAEANERGFLVSCNHPRPYGPDWAFSNVNGFQCVEVWNGPWQLMNTSCLAFWEEKLRRGERLTAVGGSDHHFSKRTHAARLSHPTSYIYCEGTPSAVALLQAVREGHMFISESPTGPRLMLRSADGLAMMGDVVRQPDDGTLSVSIDALDAAGTSLQLIGANGILGQTDLSSNEVHLDLHVEVSGTPYVRAQLIDPGNHYVRALTNPLYLE